jgi:hypothetical protein
MGQRFHVKKFAITCGALAAEIWKMCRFTLRHAKSLRYFLAQNRLAAP